MAFVYFWLLISAKIGVVTDCETKVLDLSRKYEELVRQISDIDTPRYDQLLSRIAEVDKSAVMVGSRIEGLNEQFAALINRWNSRDRTERKRLRDMENKDETDDDKDTMAELSRAQQLNMFTDGVPSVALSPAKDTRQKRKFGTMPKHL
jgi:hypothetical protein